MHTSLLQLAASKRLGATDEPVWLNANSPDISFSQLRAQLIMIYATSPAILRRYNRPRARSKNVHFIYHWAATTSMVCAPQYIFAIQRPNWVISLADSDRCGGGGGGALFVHGARLTFPFLHIKNTIQTTFKEPARRPSDSVRGSTYRVNVVYWNAGLVDCSRYYVAVAPDDDRVCITQVSGLAMGLKRLMDFVSPLESAPCVSVMCGNYCTEAGYYILCFRF